MQFAKLMDKAGRQIARPEAVTGSVSWNLTSGQAHAWDADGKKCLAEMVGARVVWVAAVGIRLEGLEPIDMEGTKFRAQAWQVIF